jgi:hypothetical protein
MNTVARKQFGLVIAVLDNRLTDGGEVHRNEYRSRKKILGSRAWPARKIDNLVAIYEPIV